MNMNSSIPLVVSLAFENKMLIHQIQDEVYMRQPEGFVDTAYTKRVLRLHKSLYGLKQSGRDWNQKLDSTLQHIGFVQCPSEPCTYTKNIGENCIYTYKLNLSLVDDLKKFIFLFLKLG